MKFSLRQRKSQANASATITVGRRQHQLIERIIVSIAPSYKELLAQREALEVQIASARKAEVSSAVQTARQLVADFSLTVEDVFGGRRKEDHRAKRATVAPKYRNPATGETWTGRGKAPKWIAEQDRAKFSIA